MLNMFVFCPDSLEQMDEVIEARPEAICVGTDVLSSRTRAIMPLEKLGAWNERLHEQGILSYINALKMVSQKDLETTRDAFEKAVLAGSDGFYVADDAYLYWAGELEKKHGISVMDKLIIQPETLIASGMDARFYRSAGVQACSLAHELSLQEILKAAGQSDGLEVLVSGHSCWMDSRRPLLENYLAAIGKKGDFQSGHVYSLREMQRESHLPVWQDELGTHIFSDVPICSYRQIKDLKDAGIERFRIDCLLEGNEWGLRQLENYRRILNGETIEPEPGDGRDDVYHEETTIVKEK